MFQLSILCDIILQPVIGLLGKVVSAESKSSAYVL